MEGDTRGEELTALMRKADGLSAKVLVRQRPEEGGFSLLYLWFKPHYPLTRHSHDCDCMYYVISGSLIMGRQVLRAGDSFFVPADAPYQYDAGPEGVEVLEVRRGVEHFATTMLPTPAQRLESMRAAVGSNSEGWSEMTQSPTEVAAGS
jgi:quercetin dioxygenase-like cupin family protein